jgi:general secretion pathway protein K
MATFSRVGWVACPFRARISRRKGRPGGLPYRRGSALLTVLWISAGLAAVGFALANTVRGETDRASTALDELRSYYLAAGAVDKAAVEVLWSAVAQTNRRLAPRTTRVDYQFPSGMAHVEIIPEAAKLDVNSIRPVQFARMLTYMGVDPERVQAIIMGVQAWKDGQGASFSSIQAPTFPGPGTSFQEIEELLAVRGITPEIFYGTYVPVTDNPEPGKPRLARRSGLIDCLSVFGSKNLVDANTADPAVLYALGVPEEGIRALVAMRNIEPLNEARLNGIRPMLGEGGGSLRLEGNSILTIRATGRVRLPNGQLSDLKRTVGAMVKYMPKGFDSPIHILRWYDTAWAN